jgi:hypothetical protein
MNNGVSRSTMDQPTPLDGLLHYDEPTTRQRRGRGTGYGPSIGVVQRLGERIASATRFAGEGHQAALDQTIEGRAKLGRLGIDRLAELSGSNGIATLRLERLEDFRIELLAAGLGTNVTLVRTATATTGTTASCCCATASTRAAAFANDGSGRASRGLIRLCRGTLAGSPSTTTEQFGEREGSECRVLTDEILQIPDCRLGVLGNDGDQCCFGLVGECILKGAGEVGHGGIYAQLISKRQGVKIFFSQKVDVR